MLNNTDDGSVNDNVHEPQMPDDKQQPDEGMMNKEDDQYEGGALGTAGNNESKPENASSGIQEADEKITTKHTVFGEGNNKRDEALSPHEEDTLGMDHDERNYEGGALGSAGSGTGTRDSEER